MASPLSFTKKFVFTGKKEFEEAKKSSVLRFTTASGLKATAVKLADGTLLEVKRGTAVVKLKFSSVEAWCESVGEDSISELTLENKTSKPKKPVTSTLDLDLIAKIYKENYRGLPKITADISGGYAWDESEKMLRAATEKKDQEMIARLIEWRKQFHYYSPSYKSPQGYTYRNERGHEYKIHYNVSGIPICYIKEDDTLVPLYLCKASTVFAHWGYNTNNLFKHLFDFPGKTMLYYKKKVGLTFESVGIPLDENGKPNLWAQDSYNKGANVISKYVFPLAE